MKISSMLLSAAGLLLPFSATFAQPAQDTLAMSEPNLLNTTCADYRAALLVADPGKKPSAAAKIAAAEAQDDIINGLMWIHGFAAGRAAPGTVTPPLTKSWMAAAVGKLAQACDAHSPDGKMRISDLAGKL